MHRTLSGSMKTAPRKNTHSSLPPQSSPPLVVVGSGDRWRLAGQGRKSSPTETAGWMSTLKYGTQLPIDLTSSPSGDMSAFTTGRSEAQGHRKQKNVWAQSSK